MENVFEVAGAILISFGGSGIILFALSSWLGKIWASRILEGEKQKYTLEIENYKNKLNKEVNLINSKIDKSLHVTKLQYDKEFSIYLEIWEKLAACVISTKNLYPGFEDVPSNPDELKAFNEKKWKDFVGNYNDFSNNIIKYSPFYEEELYKEFTALRNLCDKQARMFKMFEFDVKYNASFALARETVMSGEERKEVYIEFPKSIDELQSTLQNAIREHLKSLQAIEN